MFSAYDHAYRVEVLEVEQARLVEQVRVVEQVLEVEEEVEQVRVVEQVRLVGREFAKMLVVAEAEAELF